MILNCSACSLSLGSLLLPLDDSKATRAMLSNMSSSKPPAMADDGCSSSTPAAQDMGRNGRLTGAGVFWVGLLELKGQHSIVYRCKAYIQ